ncbi:MAG: bifunctional hydroxymethylpyrimidine kinase/phosphomethylpyrimidine kinase [Actinobacteria bacterium]|nr:bifunctional hydroxymethylpyrimidine kinase/phosphomethylpyrimidine kinase [Actinomycetota bacterium]
MRKVLAIGGSDPSCGAGVQIDAFTIARFGALPYTAITAVTAQNSAGVTRVMSVPKNLLQEQIDAVLADSPVDAIKTGMLATAEILDAVAELIRSLGLRPVVDPVLAASDGTPLFRSDAAGAYASLVSQATIVTPNIPEAETLSGITISSEADMQNAAEAFLDMGSTWVLVKGGHLESGEAADLLTGPRGSRWLRAVRESGGDVRGTGCMLASAVAASLAKGADMEDAVLWAKEFVRQAMTSAISVGTGARQPSFHIQTSRGRL